LGCGTAALRAGALTGALAAPAWADHPLGGALRQPADPLLTAVLWGAAALLVAVVVMLIALAFTRRTAEPEE
jgi:hypothetical protein